MPIVTVGKNECLEHNVPQSIVTDKGKVLRTQQILQLLQGIKAYNSGRL